MNPGMGALMAQPGKREEAAAALLGGFCLFLATLEYLIPKPVPFMRLGLANVPLMLALDIVGLKYVALLVFIKVLGQAIITGTLVSYICLFSLAGTCSAATAMYLLRRPPLGFGPASERFRRRFRRFVAARRPVCYNSPMAGSVPGGRACPSTPETRAPAAPAAPETR